MNFFTSSRATIIDQTGELVFDRLACFINEISWSKICLFPSEFLA